MKNHIKGRSAKYGSIAIILTVFVVIAALLFNVVISLLATRFEWMYLPLEKAGEFKISEECEDYLREYVFSKVDSHNAKLPEESREKLVVTFCDSEEAITSEDWKKHVYTSVTDLADKFPEYIEIRYLNIWERPGEARELGATSTTDVVCSFRGKHESVNMKDLYIYESSTSDTIEAYNGEKMIAACLMRVTLEDSPSCYLTANHGESFDGYEFMRTAIESGYTLGFLDLSVDEIPEDCDLLITYDPQQDLVSASGVSSVSEADKIDAYLNGGGKYMVFLSADSFASGDRANLEGLLKKWGIEYKHEKGQDSVELCHLIKDTSNSLTVDGYTILADNAKSGLGAEITKNMPSNNVFSNSTCISFAEGYEKNANGDYTATVNGKVRTATALMTSRSTAEAWSGGKAVARASDEPFVLMSATVQECDNGETACLVASASTDFASDAHMKSAVTGNGRSTMEIFKYFGMDSAPSELVIKYFGNLEIETLTTQTANIITVVLAALPTVACAVLGIVILVRRKYS